MLASAGVALLSILAWGPFSGVQGSGVVKEETRQVSDFHRVRVRQGINVDVTVGPRTSVVVSGDDNLLSMVKTEVENGELSIRVTSANGYSTKAGLTVRVTTPTLDGADAQSGAQLTLTGLSAPKVRISATSGAGVEARDVALAALSIDASGGANVRARGKTQQLEVNCSGGAALEAEDLVADGVRIEAGGGASASVNAAKRIDGDLSAGASVSVRGAPSVRNLETSSGASYHFEGAREL
jgi:hypothetical protein